MINDELGTDIEPKYVENALLSLPANRCSSPRVNFDYLIQCSGIFIWIPQIFGGVNEEVPLYEPTNVIGEEVLPGIKRVLASGWLTLGEETRAFEREFAEAHRSENGIAVNSCTSALYASLRALDIGNGDRVVVPAITFSATANVVRLLGGEVVLCDVTESGNVDPDSLRRLLNERKDVSGVIPVHLYGLPCDMPEIVEIAEAHDLFVIEDCAHAPGATIGGRPVGSFGDAGCFSFYATKNMTTGEGGMVTTSNSGLAERIRKLRNHHQTKSPEEKKETWGYDVDGLGFNFRMSEIEAVIGRSQLERLPEMTKSRRQVAARYKEALDLIDGLTWVGETADKDHVFHLFVIRVGEEYPMSRDQLYDLLSEHDIITGVHYPPISALDYYQGVEGETETANQLSNQILSLPMYPDMDAEDQDRVIRALQSV